MLLDINCKISLVYPSKIYIANPMDLYLVGILFFLEIKIIRMVLWEKIRFDPNLIPLSESAQTKTTVLVGAAHCNFICKDSNDRVVDT